MKQRDKSYITYLPLALLIFFLAACASENIIDNPLPLVEITGGPGNYNSIASDEVEFVWKGSYGNTLFKYRLLYYNITGAVEESVTWSDYSDDTFVLFENLDDGKYEFQIKPLSENIEGDEISRVFIVDAITGPAFSFFKKSNIVKKDSTFRLGVNMEDIDSLSFFVTVLNFDPALLNVTSLDEGGYSYRNYGQSLEPKLDDAALKDSINTYGEIRIFSRLFDEIDSTNASLSGSGEILSFEFLAVAKEILKLNSRKLMPEKLILQKYLLPPLKMPS